MSSHPQFLLESLHRHEHHSDYLHTSIATETTNNPHFQEEELASLLHKQQENQLQITLEENPFRGEAVEWMLNVVHYYSFSPLTAVLSVNYLDRFLHSFGSHGGKPWMPQLAAVACVSLAAKVEETDVPLLLDFQVEETKYVFEAKTIQRMEMLVLSTLQWRMNPVTPICFLDFILMKMRLRREMSEELLERCHCLLLSLLSDYRFMSFLPSAMATATMLYVINSFEPTIHLDHQDPLMEILGTEKEEVERCFRLIEEASTRVDVFRRRRKRRFPGSPKGVVDVCFSSDDSPPPSAPSSPPHLSKRSKS